MMPIGSGLEVGRGPHSNPKEGCHPSNLERRVVLLEAPVASGGGGAGWVGGGEAGVELSFPGPRSPSPTKLLSFSRSFSHSK